MRVGVEDHLAGRDLQGLGLVERVGAGRTWHVTQHSPSRETILVIAGLFIWISSRQRTLPATADARLVRVALRASTTRCCPASVPLIASCILLC